MNWIDVSKLELKEQYSDSEQIYSKIVEYILKQLEDENAQVGKSAKPTTAISQSREGYQLSFFQLDDPVLCQIRDEIHGLDINHLTPMEALNKLNDIKTIVSGKSNN